MNKNIYLATAFIFLLSFFLHSQESMAPESYCGVKELTSVESANYRAQLNSVYGAAGLQNNKNIIRNEKFELPIHLYIIKEDDGSTVSFGRDYFEQDVIDGFSNTLKYLNRDFHENFEFHLCEVDEVLSSRHATIRSPADIDAYIQENLSEIYDPSSIRVYVNGGSTGNGSSEHGILLPSFRVFTPSFVKHEFGHFFGLKHTFERATWRVNGEVCIALYPDNSPVEDCFSPASIRGCNSQDPAECYGDFIWDTAVQLAEGQCPTFGGNAQCYEYCDVDIDGETYRYRNDQANVMGIHC